MYRGFKRFTRLVTVIWFRTKLAEGKYKQMEATTDVACAVCVATERIYIVTKRNKDQIKVERTQYQTKA